MLNMIYVKAFAFYIFFSIGYVDGLTKYQKLDGDRLNVLRKIKERLVNFPTNDSWAYNPAYPTLETLFLNGTLIEEGVRNRGIRSKQAIETQFQKALNGENVSLYIFGESVSVGADLGKNNVENTFHYALAHWWNNTIGTITGCKMIRRVIAIGGAATNYFDRCWQEYIDDNETFDMALWEFNINDNGKSEHSKAIERFIRSIYNRYKSLDLIFAIFYTRGLLSVIRNSK